MHERIRRMLTARQGRAIHGCGKQRERPARTCRPKSFIPRPYVFALDLDCNGRVESPSSAAPAIFPCQVGQPVEVTERLVWNRVLVAGHYVINNPQAARQRACERPSRQRAGR